LMGGLIGLAWLRPAVGPAVEDQSLAIAVRRRTASLFLILFFVLLAAQAALRWSHHLAPAHSAWVPVSALAVPLGFLALVALLVVMKALNLGLASFEGFKLALAATELAWGAYTGFALSRMFTQAGGDDEALAETLA